LFLFNLRERKTEVAPCRFVTLHVIYACYTMAIVDCYPSLD